jgi:hypothetical protein
MTLSSRSPRSPAASRRLVIVIVHSDRRGHFVQGGLRAELTAGGLQNAMSGVGSAGENAALQSFPSSLQTNVLDRPEGACATSGTRRSCPGRQSLPAPPSPCRKTSRNAAGSAGKEPLNAGRMPPAT